MKYTLTRNQAAILAERNWEKDYEGTLKLIHSFGVDLIEWDLPWFMEKIVPQEHARHLQEERDRKKGFNAEYSKVNIPEVGKKYHLAWAHKGCVWKLHKLLPNGKCQLMTPKTKKILTANTADLLNLRGK